MSTAKRPADPTGDGIVGKLLAVVVGTSVGVFGLAFGTLLALLAIGVLVVSGLAEFSASLALVVGLVMTQGVGCFSVALAYARTRHRIVDFLTGIVGERSWLSPRRFDIPVRVPSLRDLGYVVGAYVLAFALVITIAVAVQQTGVQTANNAAAETGLENPGLLLWLIPGSILLIGPGEEILFRGVVQGRFRERFGPVVSIVLASFVFAAVHFTALQGAASARLVTIGILLFPALVFGTVYELTENIVVPALVHGFYNATLFGTLYVGTQLSGMGGV